MEKRVSKRSQVTIFIIIAIVLVSAAGVAYFMTKHTTPTDKYFLQSDIKPGFDSIKNSVYECMKMTSTDSLDLTGIQGGYYKEPKEFFDLGWSFIPYYYKDATILMPTNIQIQDQLSLYVDDNLNSCLETIKVNDFTLSYTKPQTKTIINKGEVKFNIDMPVTVKKADKITQLQLKDNPISIDSKLYEMLEIAKFISDSHKEDPSMICISCTLDLAKERELYVDMLNFNAEDSSNLIVISTNKTSYPKVFEFLNKYNKNSTNSVTDFTE
ncbi:Uncharacterised protein [uncultured archaeon]|nr:Uncharacterised protein [uncultured archaeon]